MVISKIKPIFKKLPYKAYNPSNFLPVTDLSASPSTNKRELIFFCFLLIDQSQLMVKQKIFLLTLIQYLSLHLQKEINLLLINLRSNAELTFLFMTLYFIGDKLGLASWNIDLYFVINLQFFKSRPGEISTEVL